MSDLAAALMVAIRAHAGQVDKQGAPYLRHVLRVVEAVSDEAKVVAALHDCLEDGGDEAQQAVWDLDLLQAERNALIALTRIKGVAYADYIAYIAAPVGDPNSNRLAREVKLADLRDNLGRIPDEPHPIRSAASVKWDREWAPLKARYEKALATLEATQ